MKFPIIIIFSIFSILNSKSQSTIDDIGTALKSGSAKELINYFNKITELKINDKGASYTKIQAESILKDFFTKYPTKDFEYIHKGSSPEGLKYNIGKYTYSTGKFKIVMLLKKINEDYVIDTINFNHIASK